jgi:hypothetical protein
MSTRPIVLAIGAALVIVSLAALANATLGDTAGKAESSPADLAAIQGTWERSLADNHGKAAGRVEKRTGDHQETVTCYGADGTVLASHSAEFKLARNGPVRVFSYSVEVTEGADKGTRYTGAYISRVQGDTWYEIHGMMIGQEKETPGVLVWKRARET